MKTMRLSKINTALRGYRVGAEERPISSPRCGKNLLSLAAVFIWTVCLLFAAQPCNGQCPLHLPPKCQLIADEVEALQAERKDLQAELKLAVGSQKQGKAGQIMNLLSQITAKQKEVDRCAVATGKSDLSVTLKGTARLLMNNPQVFSPSEPVSIKLTYLRWVRDQLVVNGFFPTLEFRILGSRPPSIIEASSHFSSNCGRVNAKTGELFLTLTLPVRVVYRMPGNQSPIEDAGFSNLAIT